MKAFLANAAVTAVFLCILLVSAGCLGYGPAWAYAAIGVLTNAGMRVILRKRPDLARERSRPGPGGEAWDRRLLGIGFLLNVGMLVVAGLDSGRFHWTPRVSSAWSAFGAAGQLSWASLTPSPSESGGGGQASPMPSLSASA